MGVCSGNTVRKNLYLNVCMRDLEIQVKKPFPFKRLLGSPESSTMLFGYQFFFSLVDPFDTGLNFINLPASLTRIIMSYSQAGCILPVMLSIPELISHGYCLLFEAKSSQELDLVVH